VKKALMAMIALLLAAAPATAVRVQLPGGPNWSFNEDIVAGPDPHLRAHEVTVQGGIDHAGYYPLDKYWDWKTAFKARTSFGEVTFHLSPADSYNAFLADNRVILFPAFHGKYPTTVYIAYIAVNWWESDGHRWLHPYRWTYVDVMTVEYYGMIRVKLADWCLRGVMGSCDPGIGQGEGYAVDILDDAFLDVIPVKWENVPAVPGFPERAGPNGVERIGWNIWVLAISTCDGIEGIRIRVPPKNPSGNPPHIWVVAVVAEYPDGSRYSVVPEDWCVPAKCSAQEAALDGTFRLPDVRAVIAPWVSPRFGHGVSSLMPPLDVLPYESCVDDQGRLWLSIGGELVPFRFNPRHAELLNVLQFPDAVLRLPRPARAVYLLYLATCWRDDHGNPVDQYPILVQYADGTASGLTVRIVDWCALEPKSYNERQRSTAARACPDPQPYWVTGEPLAFQTPALVFRDRGDGNHPIAWLLKIQAPPGKRIVSIDFPERWWRKGGYLWLLAVTELADDGKYYSVFPGEGVLWDPTDSGSCPYTPHSKLSWLAEIGVPFVLRYFVDKTPAPTPDMSWMAYVRGVVPPSDGLATNLNVILYRTAWCEQGHPKATKGLKLALSMLAALFDAAIERQAEDLGLRAYRAYPAVVQGVVWSSDSSQLLIYQPTLGVSFYGPPVLVRALNSYASALLAAAEDLVLHVALGCPQLAPWQYDPQLRSRFVQDVQQVLGISRDAAADFTRALDRGEATLGDLLRWTGAAQVGASAVTALSTLLSRSCGLSTDADVYTYWSAATGEIMFLVVAPRALPTKGGVTTGCFCGTLTDNLNKVGSWLSSDFWSIFRRYFNNPLINGAMATLLSWGVEWAIILSAGLMAGLSPAAAELLASGAPYLAALGSSAIMALLDWWLNNRTWDQVLKEIAVGAAAGAGVYKFVVKYISKIREYAGRTVASKIIARYYDFAFNWSTNSILAATSNLWLTGGLNAHCPFSIRPT